MRRILACCSAVLVVLIALPSSAVVTRGEDLTVLVSQTIVLPARNVSRVAIGDDALLDVRVLADVSQLLLIGQAPGVTDIRIWLRNGDQTSHQVTILLEAPQNRLEQVRQSLGAIEGVAARQVGNRIIIEGQVLTAQDFARVEAIAQLNQAVNLTSPVGLNVEAMIYFDVKVVEIRKQSLTNLGVDWGDFLNGPSYSYIGDYSTNNLFRGTDFPVTPTGNQITNLALGGNVPLDVGGGNVFLGMSTSLTSTLNILANRGEARFLAEPKLVCRSGGSADFLAGGEVPIPVTNPDGSIAVEFKEFGIGLTLEPVSDPSGYISSKVGVEVSDIDPSIQVLGIPGFITRRTNTEMNVRDGETMVLSGLLSSDRGKDVTKVPGLGNIPILGELFKSREFRDDETELVVFVTPSLIDPSSKINRDMLDRAQQLKDSSDESLRFSLKD
ncbi:MAG: type II and III secretion system protein family protein [Gammaproteobacteria bacterium]